MVSKMKKIILNPWIIAVVAPMITTTLVAFIKKVNIIDAIKIVYKFLTSILNYKVSMWMVILFFAVIVFSLICYAKITESSEELQPKWINYTKDQYKEWYFKWKYEKIYGNQYRIEELRTICFCGCGLNRKDRVANTYYSNGVLLCPKCGKQYNMVDNEVLEELQVVLQHNIESGNYNL